MFVCISIHYSFISFFFFPLLVCLSTIFFPSLSLIYLPSFLCIYIDFFSHHIHIHFFPLVHLFFFFTDLIIQQTFLFFFFISIFPPHPPACRHLFSGCNIFLVNLMQPNWRLNISQLKNSSSVNKFSLAFI